MEKGLVSIITPIYNGEKYISITLDSVLGQTYSNWEMLLVNDGSKDRSLEIINKYAQSDSRIQVLSQENGGIGIARNNGIRRAKGQYHIFLDGDDTWEPAFLESQLNFMKEKNAQLVYASHTRIDKDGKECLKPFVVPEKITYKDLLKTCYISCLTGLYDTSTFGKIYMREDMKSLREDYIYWLEIIKKVKVAYGNQAILSNYRILASSTSRKKIKVIKPHFKVLYKVEKLGLFKSMYYMLNWAVISYFKYRK